MQKFSLFFSLLILILVGCTSSKNRSGDVKVDQGLEKLAECMIGRFSSEAQSKKDTSFFNISLIMAPVWSNRTDGKWLYVEQAVASKLDKPYRQRVYHLQHIAKNKYTSDIYTLKDAASFIGIQDDPTKMEKFKFEDIELKEGCTVFLTYESKTYLGGTDRDKCPSELRGAKYATTKIELKKGELTSWDQGFDATGKQVWGATKGGYIFKKL